MSHAGYAEQLSLATLKTEGAAAVFDTAIPQRSRPKRREISKTRLIELWYDPKESLGRIDLEPIREAIQAQQSCNNYTEDEMYLIIKSLANEFIPKGGF